MCPLLLAGLAGQAGRDRLRTAGLSRADGPQSMGQCHTLASESGLWGPSGGQGCKMRPCFVAGWGVFAFEATAAVLGMLRDRCTSHWKS
eukprot:5801341-Alexandrium_andersonii.AAC.1